jgi:hypothetical protein
MAHLFNANGSLNVRAMEAARTAERATRAAEAAAAEAEAAAAAPLTAPTSSLPPGYVMAPFGTAQGSAQQGTAQGAARGMVQPRPRQLPSFDNVPLTERTALLAQRAVAASALATREQQRAAAREMAAEAEAERAARWQPPCRRAGRGF